ncbi:hypothetical protein A8432_002112 [Escherichia coli]|nr:hypothetical protein [Escherichia coli]
MDHYCTVRDTWNWPVRSLITFPQKRLLKKYAVTQNAAIVVMALNAIAVLSVVGIWAMIAAMLLI